MASFDAVIFDLDGTLLDTETLSSSCVLHALAEYGVRLHEVEWALKKRIIGLPGKEWTTMIIDSLPVSAIHDQSTFAQLSWKILLERWEYYMSEFASDIAIMRGVEEIISHCLQLKQREHKPLRFALATSSRAASVEKKLGRFGNVRDLMDVIVCGDDEELREGKPAPDIFLLAGKRFDLCVLIHISYFCVASMGIASRLGVEASRCLVFEDSLSGIRAGKAAHMTVIAVPDPRIFHDDKDCEEYRRIADYCLPSIAEAIPLLQ